jgi:hypothetical protein
VALTEEQPTTAMPRPKPAYRLGLSGKLLLLTIPLVMIAEVLIYVPSIAGFAGAADPFQHRRPRGGHQDGAPAPAVGQRRSAGGDRS